MDIIEQSASLIRDEITRLEGVLQILQPVKRGRPKGSRNDKALATAARVALNGLAPATLHKNKAGRTFVELDTDAALPTALTFPMPARKTRQWTPAQRAAQAKRMRLMMARKRRAAQ